MRYLLRANKLPPSVTDQNQGLQVHLLTVTPLVTRVQPSYLDPSWCPFPSRCVLGIHCELWMLGVQLAFLRISKSMTASHIAPLSLGCILIWFVIVTLVVSQGKESYGMRQF